MKRLLVILGLAAVLLLPLAAEQQSAGLLQIEEIALRAQMENPQVLKALRALKNSEEALVGERAAVGQPFEHGSSLRNGPESGRFCQYGRRPDLCGGGSLRQSTG